MPIRRLCLIAALLLLAACDPYRPTLNPDYTIRVAHDPAHPGSDTVLMPLCPSYGTEIPDPYDDQPMPQYGCATAQNLAAMVENPDDLVMGRNLASTRGVSAVGSVKRYDANQTRGLIVTGSETNAIAVTTSSNAAPSIAGDVAPGVGGGAPASAPVAP